MSSKPFGIFLSLALLGALTIPFPARSHSAQERALATSSQSAGQRLSFAESHKFVTYKSADGVRSRRMTEQEERSFHPNERTASMQVISADDGTLQSAAPSQDEASWRITLRGTQQLENHPEAKSAFYVLRPD